MHILVGMVPVLVEVEPAAKDGEVADVEDAVASVEERLVDDVVQNYVQRHLLDFREGLGVALVASGAEHEH